MEASQAELDASSLALDQKIEQSKKGKEFSVSNLHRKGKLGGNVALVLHVTSTSLDFAGEPQ